MIRKNIACLLFLLPLAVAAQNKKYALKGKVASLNAPAKAYLSYRTDSSSVLDSVLLVNGNFAFSGTVTRPTRASVIIDHKGEGLRNLKKADYLSVYLDETLSITSTDSIKFAKLSGSKVNDDLQEYIALAKPFNERINAIYMEADKLPEEEKKKPGFDEEVEAKAKVVEDEQKIVMASFIKSHPASVVSMDALRTFGGPFPEYNEVNPLFQSLNAAVKETETGKDYQKNLDRLKLIAIGAPAPEFSQNDSLGKPVALSSFRGKYVLIDFWASWCGPCRKENPNLVATYNKFKANNFTVLGVSLDSKKENWLKAVEKDNLDWTQVSDLKYWKNAVAEQYAVKAIPQNFLLDPKGKIIAKNLTGTKLSEKLEEVLGAPKSNVKSEE